MAVYSVYFSLGLVRGQVIWLWLDRFAALRTSDARQNSYRCLAAATMFPDFGISNRGAVNVGRGNGACCIWSDILLLFTIVAAESKLLRVAVLSEIYEVNMG